MSDKLACLILSKDRLLLFDGAVRSIISNFPHVDEYFYLIVGNENYPLYEKWHTDSENPVHKYTPSLMYVERGIKIGLETILKKIKETCKFCLFMTDDTFFFRKFPYPKDMLFRPFENPQLLTVGLRMGENTTVQNPYNPSEKLNVPAFNDKPYVEWYWTEKPHSENTGYPISMDGHIYRTLDMLDMTESIEFKNLREWEGNLVGNLWNNKGKFPRFTGDMMGCFRESCTVNIPISMVQHPFQANVSPYGVSTEHMLNSWKEGKRIDLEKMFGGLTVNGSHMLLPLQYKD